MQTGLSTLSTAIILLLFAMGLTFLELFIPSGGMICVMSLVAAVLSVVEAFQVSSAYGYLFLVLNVTACTAGIVYGVRILGRSPLALKTSLTKEAGFQATQDMANMVGKDGVAETILRPSGIARIDKERIHVVAEVGLISADTPIRVVKVEGNKILVSPVENIQKVLRKE